MNKGKSKIEKRIQEKEKEIIGNVDVDKAHKYKPYKETFVRKEAEGREVLVTIEKDF